MENWFKTNLHLVSVNGLLASTVWEECLTRYREGSLPSAVTSILKPVNSADAEVVNTSSDLHGTGMELKASQDDDIDALLSAAGTFVHDRKTSVSSVIGPQSSVCTGPQLMQRNVDVLSQSQESSMNVCSDVSASATSTTYGVNHHTAASSELLSSCVIFNSSANRAKSVHHWLSV